jgi:hypothetical protein
MNRQKGGVQKKLNKKKGGSRKNKESNSVPSIQLKIEDVISHPNQENGVFLLNPVLVGAMSYLDPT